jgi:hypothetical protein
MGASAGRVGILPERSCLPRREYLSCRKRRNTNHSDARVPPPRASAAIGGRCHDAPSASDPAEISGVAHLRRRHYPGETHWKAFAISQPPVWERRRNRNRDRINWMFTTENARAKMGRAYPKPAKLGRPQRVKTSVTRYYRSHSRVSSRTNGRSAHGSHFQFEQAGHGPRLRPHFPAAERIFPRAGHQRVAPRSGSWRFAEVFSGRSRYGPASLPGQRVIATQTVGSSRTAGFSPYQRFPVTLDQPSNPM